MIDIENNNCDFDPSRSKNPYLDETIGKQ